MYLNAGFEKNDDINAFVNKKYEGIPFSNDNAFLFFDVFDTERFLDIEIEGNITLNLTNIKNNKVKAIFEVNDKLIKIKYNGYLNIVDRPNN